MADIKQAAEWMQQGRLVKRALFALMLLMPQQDAKNPLHGDPNNYYPSVTQNLTFVTVKPTAEWTEKITKEGHYVAIFDDPNNEWRCYPAKIDDRLDPYSFAMTCTKAHEVEKEK